MHFSDMPPDVSIVIPTLNRGNLISQTLISISHQTLGTWEVIVIDDGSTDNTHSVMASWVQSDDRIHYVQRQTLPKGACACRNLGTSLAQGRYVIYLDSDDLLATTSLENRVAHMNAQPDLDFAVFSGILFRHRPDDLKILVNVESKLTALDRFLSLDLPWQTMGPIWRKSSLDYYQLKWNHNLPSWQDLEFHVHALALNLNYKVIDIQDCYWRTMQNFSIGKDACTASHLKGRQHCLSEIYSHVISNPCRTPEREEFITSLYFHWMDQWLSIGQVEEAREAWQVCFKLLKIEPKLYRSGCWYINMTQKLSFHPFCHKAARRGLRKYLKLTCGKPRMIPKWSKTFMRVQTKLALAPVVYT